MTTKRTRCSVVLKICAGSFLPCPVAPDSTALLVLAARWAKGLSKRHKHPPKLAAVTIDHGLRPELRREALAVKQLARRLGVPHRTLSWRGKKPNTGLQEAARYARYRLLAEEAARSGYEHILTAHTLDDQAETVLFRLARGSGLTGLAGMADAAPIPVGRDAAIFLVRPLLRVSKARLVATLRAIGIAHSEDPTNRDPRYTRHAVARVAACVSPEKGSTPTVLHAWRRACGARTPRSNLLLPPRGGVGARPVAAPRPDCF